MSRIGLASVGDVVGVLRGRIPVAAFALVLLLRRLLFVVLLLLVLLLRLVAAPAVPGGVAGVAAGAGRRAAGAAAGLAGQGGDRRVVDGQGAGAGTVGGGLEHDTDRATGPRGQAGRSRPGAVVGLGEVAAGGDGPDDECPVADVGQRDRPRRARRTDRLVAEGQARRVDGGEGMEHLPVGLPIGGEVRRD